MNQHHPPQSDSLDDYLTLLADQRCRETLAYFQDAPTDVVSVQTLANEISKEAHGGPDQVAVHLHHSVLPRLADADTIDYDVRTQTVRYQGNAELEALLNTITESNPAETR